MYARGRRSRAPERTRGPRETAAAPVEWKDEDIAATSQEYGRGTPKGVARPRLRRQQKSDWSATVRRRPGESRLRLPESRGPGKATLICGWVDGGRHAGLRTRRRMAMSCRVCPLQFRP